MPDPDGRRVNVLISGMKCPQCATIQKPDALQGDSGFFVEHMKAESLSRPHTIDQRGSDGDINYVQPSPLVFRFLSRRTIPAIPSIIRPSHNTGWPASPVGGSFFCTVKEAEALPST